MSEDKKDKRITKRIGVNLLVDYQSDGHYLFDFCSDLSTGGIFIKTTRPKPVGSKISITLTIPDTKKTIKVDGQVIWSQPSGAKSKNLSVGMGVQFEKISDEDKIALQDFVNRYTDSTEQLQAS